MSTVLKVSNTLKRAQVAPCRVSICLCLQVFPKFVSYAFVP